MATSGNFIYHGLFLSLNRIKLVAVQEVVYSICNSTIFIAHVLDSRSEHPGCVNSVPYTSGARVNPRSWAAARRHPPSHSQRDGKEDRRDRSVRFSHTSRNELHPRSLSFASGPGRTLARFSLRRCDRSVRLLSPR